MSSPSAAPSNDLPVPPNSEDVPTAAEENNDIDVDAEMGDDTQVSAPNGANTSATTNMEDSTLVPPENTQPTTTASHQNRKDATLREFLSKMDDYAPIIPDAVTSHYLTLSGLPPPNASDPTGAATNSTPLPLARLLALATQKFIADIAADAYQYSRIRAGTSAASNNPLGNQVLPGQAGGPGAGAGGVGGVGGGAGGRGAGAGGTQLGVQRSGYGGGGQGGSGQGRTVLTMEDLGMAVGEYGVNVKRGEFYR